MSYKVLERFIVKILLKDSEGFIIWYEDGMETLNKKILFFRNLDLLYNYSFQNNLVVQDSDIVTFKTNDLSFFFTYRKMNKYVSKTLLA